MTAESYTVPSTFHVGRGAFLERGVRARDGGDVVPRCATDLGRIAKLALVDAEIHLRAWTASTVDLARSQER